MPLRAHTAPAAVLAMTAALTAALAGSASAASEQGCDDACRIDGARAYVASLVSHDPAAVPLHPEATRLEAGLQTGFSGEQIRTDLKLGPQYRVIRDVAEQHYTVRDGQVVADFVLDVGIGSAGLTTARVHETFSYDDGSISAIVADIAVGRR